jgi:adenylate kinase family enzyme
MAQRILVVGCCGAGKTTVARAIAGQHGLPLVHLDRHYWRPGWVALSDEEWGTVVEGLVAAPAWVMDGNFSGTMRRRAEFADAIVFLDISRGLCILRVLKRILLNYGRTRADMGPGCPERLDFAFLKWVWRYPGRSRLRTLEMLRSFPGSVIVLDSRKAVRAWIDAGCRLEPTG